MQSVHSMKFIIITVIGLFAFTFAHGQGFRLAGRVTDVIGTPVAGAHITLQGVGPQAGIAMKSARTDTMGAFSFVGLPQGSYRVAAHRNGYDDRQTTVSDRKSTRLNSSHKCETRMTSST